jgi:cation diffusion facilitator family transporter
MIYDKIPMPSNSSEISDQSIRFRVMTLALLVAAVLMAVKFVAYLLTDSAAILSDALESIINVVASGFALYSIHLSNQPPDSRHPYGHGKIEYFSVGFEGALITLAAIAIVYKAIPAFFQQRVVSQLDLGIILIVGTSVVNLAIGLVLVRTGQKTRSITLEADGKHLLTDVYTSIGVVVGLVLVRFTGWQQWDPIVACLVAAHIIVTGWRLLGQSYGKLMDEADPDLLAKIVKILNERRRPEWIDIHQLRTRHYGDKVHVDFHLILPRSYGLLQGHDQAKEIEMTILASLSEVAEVIVHVDPCEDPWCEYCLQEPCQDRRAQGSSARKPWRVEEAVAKRAEREGKTEDSRLR